MLHKTLQNALTQERSHGMSTNALSLPNLKAWVSREGVSVTCWVMQALNQIGYEEMASCQYKAVDSYSTHHSLETAPRVHQNAIYLSTKSDKTYPSVPEKDCWPVDQEKTDPERRRRRRRNAARNGDLWW